MPGLAGIREGRLAESCWLTRRPWMNCRWLLLARDLHREGESKRFERRLRRLRRFRGFNGDTAFREMVGQRVEAMLARNPQEMILVLCLWSLARLVVRTDSYQLLAVCRAVPRRSAQSAKSAFHS